MNVSREEGEIRYQRARLVADNLLMGVLFSTESIEDYHDALEIAYLWRLCLEGARLTPPTNERLMEATNLKSKS